MKKLFVALATLVLLWTQAISQNFSIEDVMAAPFPTELIPHHTADMFAWVFNDRGSRNIWLAEGESVRQLTKFMGDNGQGIIGLAFAKAYPALLFERGGAPNRNGELPNPKSLPNGVERSIYEFNYELDSLTYLTAGHSAQYSPVDRSMIYLKKGEVYQFDLETKTNTKLFAARGSISQLRWHPQGEAIAFRSGRGDHSYIGIYSLQSETIRFIDPSVDQDQQPVWSQDGSYLAFIRIANEKQILPFSARREGIPWTIQICDYYNDFNTRELWKSDLGAGSVFRGISANNQLFFTADDRIVFPWEKNGFTNLYSISLDGNVIALGQGSYEVQYASLSSDGKTLFCSSNENDVDRQHIYQINPNNGDKKQLTSGTGVEWLPQMNGGGKIACLGSSYNIPAHPLFINEGQTMPFAQELIAGFPTDHLVAPEQVVFSSADGLQIHGQLFKPKNASPNQSFPAVIFFHGGSRRQMLLGFHHRGYYHNAFALNQYLADQGYVVLSVNYRSGIGYGLEFREALEYGAQGASEYNDVIGAGLYLQSRNDVINNKIGLWGGSYGGYLTALGLARASNLFAAGVDIHGVHDWNVVIKNFVPSYQSENRQSFADLAFDSSPMADIDSWRSPVLVIHGDDDRNVPFSETVDLVEQLRRLNVEVEQLIFPDEVHGFLLHENWIMAYKATADFFHRQLKTRE